MDRTINVHLDVKCWKRRCSEPNV